MDIMNEEQLDFDDVMIQPQPSTIESRKDAIITRPYKFKWTGKVIEGNPAIAANMATTGTFEMAKELQKHQMFCALHKHYTAEQLIEFLENNKKEFGTNDYIFIGTGLRKNDFTKLQKVMQTDLCKNICLDAPNGYITGFVQHLNKLRHTFPESIIMAGNVVTPEKTVELIHNGADCVKVGIGCFTRNMKVKTKTGYKRIVDVKEGEEVLTHTSAYKKVINKFEYLHHKERITINGIECTPNHKFYVVNKVDISKINENNYLDFGYWVAAKDLNTDTQVLIEIK